MAKPRKSAGKAQGITDDRIKRNVVIAMFSDDEFLDRFVLKGGNALDIVHHLSARASFDIDLSMEGGFDEAELDTVRQKILKALQVTFRADGYEVFDLTMQPTPMPVSPDVADFWGGYDLGFKLIDTGSYKEFGGNLNELRRRARPLGLGQARFSIDVSKFEYVEGKQAAEIDGYRVYVYSPTMMVAEKLRAICQQMPEYGPLVNRSRPGAARGRDYVDIHTLVEQLKLDMMSGENTVLVSKVFGAKRVPLPLLRKLRDYREFHRADFQRVRDTVKPGFDLKDFDFYADYVEKLAGKLASQLIDVPSQKPFGT